MSRWITLEQPFTGKTRWRPVTEALKGREGFAVYWLYVTVERPLYVGSTPYQVSSSGLGGLVRLLPYRWRRSHRWFAAFGGYYWLPCPVCGREYGGHEGGGYIPNPGDDSESVICSECTRKRNLTRESN